MASKKVQEEWAWLPANFLELILNKLIQYSDYLRFSAVCKRWCFIALDQKKKRIESWNNRQPLLLIASIQNGEIRRSLCNPNTGTVYESHLSIPYDHHNMHCRGSSHGWLAFAMKRSNQLIVRLINPISGQIIDLPSIMDVRMDKNDYIIPVLWELIIQKIIVSSDPTKFPTDYVVVAIISVLNGGMACIKSGDESWTFIGDHYGIYSDAIFSKGKLYGVNGVSMIVSFQIFGNLESELLFSDIRFMDNDYKVYLVEARDGDLLLIQRSLHDNLRTTIDFAIFKFVEDDAKNKVVVKTKSLGVGGDALFLGDNTTVSMSVIDSSDYKPNCIYYTDDDLESIRSKPLGPRDIGVFNIEDGKFGLLYQPDLCRENMPPPIWVTTKLR